MESVPPIVIFQKTYHGFEDIYDIDRDMAECLNNDKATIIPPEFRGELTVTVTYKPSPEDPK